MKKKENKRNIDAKTVENLINRGKSSKISEFMAEGRVSKEGVKKYLAEKPLAALEAFKYDLKAVENYPFSDFYPTFEDYINSALCKKLHNQTEDDAIRCWINMFPSNSEELLSLYDRLDEEAKSRLLTFCTYRSRYISANPDIRLNYLNCFEGLFQLFAKRLDIDPNSNCKSDLSSIFDLMFKYSIYFNESWLDKAAAKYPRSKNEDTIEGIKDRYFYCRLNNLNSYYQSPLVFYTHEEEFDFIFDRIMKRNRFESFEMSMLNTLYVANTFCSNPDNTSFKSYGKVEKIGERFEQKVYEELLKPAFNSAVNSTSLDGNSPIFEGAIELVLNGREGRYFELEKDEKYLDFVFAIVCKRYSPSPYHIVKLVSKPGSIITKHMHEMSIVFANHMGEVLYNKDLATAKDILKIQLRVSMGTRGRKSRIEAPFGVENPSYQKHFSIDKLSEEDFSKIVKYIDWDYIENYTKNDKFIDYDFAIKHFEYYCTDTYSIGAMITALSSLSDAMKFVEYAKNYNQEIGKRVKDLCKDLLERRLQYKRSTMTAAEIAKLMTVYGVKIPYSDWFSAQGVCAGIDYGSSSDRTLFNPKIKVSDILANL